MTLFKIYNSHQSIYCQPFEKLHLNIYLVLSSVLASEGYSSEQSEPRSCLQGASISGVETDKLYHVLSKCHEEKKE